MTDRAGVYQWEAKVAAHFPGLSRSHARILPALLAHRLLPTGAFLPEPWPIVPADLGPTAA